MGALLASHTVVLGVGDVFQAQTWEALSSRQQPKLHGAHGLTMDLRPARAVSRRYKAGGDMWWYAGGCEARGRAGRCKADMTNADKLAQLHAMQAEG